ncbi:hypothetical protein HYW20_03515 [Candidatus Woesearchaeota archaeon]|nr:hypothetical protein [Candidatus Woesearchaeota archaeon]
MPKDGQSISPEVIIWVKEDVFLYGLGSPTKPFGIDRFDAPNGILFKKSKDSLELLVGQNFLDSMRRIQETISQTQSSISK